MNSSFCAFFNLKSQGTEGPDHTNMYLKVSVFVSTTTKQIFSITPAFSFCFHLSTLMCTFWCVLAHHLHENHWKLCWKRHYMTLFLAAFSQTSVFTYSHYKQSLLKKVLFQNNSLLKPFSIAFIFSVFGRFSIDDRRKRIKKYAFSHEIEIALSRPLKSFARKFSNIDFFSENLTTETWWVSHVRLSM